MKVQEGLSSLLFFLLFSLLFFGGSCRVHGEHAHTFVETSKLSIDEKNQLATFFKNVSFVHIPKNGGSTMENTLLEWGAPFGYAAYRTKALKVTQGVNFLLNKASYCQPTPSSAGQCSRPGLCAEQVCAFWHIPPFTFTEPYHPVIVHDLRFCHIRNPFTRSVSELLYIHRTLKTSSASEIAHRYLRILNSLLSNPSSEINLYRKQIFYENNPNIRPSNSTPHPAHQVPAVSPSSHSPSIVLPFPFDEAPNERSFPDFPECFMNPHEHCHNIPESRYVEPFVTADYIQDLYYYLEKTNIDCYEILRMLQKKHETELTKSTGVNCNFPMRFEWYAHDFNLFLQRCGPLPDYVHPGEDRPDEKYLDILAFPEVKEKLQELFWEDTLRFGYKEYPV